MKVFFYFTCVLLSAAGLPASRASITDLYQKISVPGLPDDEAIDLAKKALDSGAVSSPAEAAQVVRIVGFPGYSADPAEREAMREKRTGALKRLGIERLAIVDPTKIGSNLLVLSAGLAGLDVDQKMILRVIRDESTPREVRLVAAEALLAQGDLDPEAKASFIQMTKDPWFYVKSSDLGSSSPRRVYPLRETGKEGLNRLGIKFKEVLVPESQVDPEWGVKFSEPVFTVEGE